MSDAPVDHEFFEEVQREHDELRELLGEVHRVLAERLEKVAEVSERLASLSEHVETHFQEEEIAGFFDQVVERAPRLSDRVDRLRTEHQALLGAVRSLYDAATQGDGSADWWKRMEGTFHDFSKDLMHHESHENDLLQEAYGEDLGTGD